MSDYTASNNGYTLKLVVNEDSYSIVNNTSKVSWALYLIADSYNYFSDWSFNARADVDGEVYNETKYRSISKYGTLTIASGSKTITHNDNGAKSISVSASISATGASYMPGNISVSGTKDLTTIPRFPTGCAISFDSKTLNSIKINWSCNQNCKQVQYRLNGGSWVDTLPAGSSKSSGSFNITGLEINTQYLIECDFQRADSSMWSSHNTPADIPSTRQTTYNKATISSAPNLNLGNNETIQYANPSGNTIKLSIQNTTGTAFYCQDRTVTGTSYTFNFTDAELDLLYKAMGTSNSLNARVYLKTFIDQSNYYYDYAQITITLTGNQKTSHTNVNGSWKRGKIWIKIREGKNSNWKRGVVWKNVEGTWKRCI